MCQNCLISYISLCPLRVNMPKVPDFIYLLTYFYLFILIKFLSLITFLRRDFGTNQHISAYLYAKISWSRHIISWRNQHFTARNICVLVSKFKDLSCCYGLSITTTQAQWCNTRTARWISAEISWLRLFSRVPKSADFGRNFAEISWFYPKSGDFGRVLAKISWF